MGEPSADTTGLTKDAGWQIGVRRSVAAEPGEVWEHLMSPEGTDLWLGPDADLVPEPKRSYETADGASGEIRSYHPGRRIRLTWHPAGWKSPSTIQVTAVANATGTSIGFHQERLSSRERREEMRRRWGNVLERLAARWYDDRR